MSQPVSSFDISVIRPALHHQDIGWRGRDLSIQQRRQVRKALRTLHSLEIMAVNVYRFQISAADNELNRQLIVAMCNEMTHVQDFLVKLYEYGQRPSCWRWVWWLVGLALGLGSRLLGNKSILRTGIFVETKAVHHYSQLLAAAPWDQQTRQIIAKDQADENGHIQTWRRLLAELNTEKNQ